MPKTQITAKQLYENKNTSDVFSRLVIMGILRLLNQKLKYTQIWEDTEEGTQEVTVPFFFDFSGGAGTSEKFIQDNYMNWSDDECTSMGIKKMNGDYKPIPYGVLSLESTNIESGNISNRFVMGQFQKRINGELKPYVACLYSIPLTMGFTINIACDTVNTMWKIEQSYREFFYKNKTFHINYRGTVVPCRIGFPESLTETKTANYTMGAQQKDGADVKLSFSLQCETYQPVFDPFTEIAAEHNIKNFQGGITLQEKSSLIEKDGKYEINHNEVRSENGYIEAEHIDKLNIVTGENILLKWNFFYNYSDLLHVDILYKEYGDEEFHTILNNIENHNCCHLSLSDQLVQGPIIDVIIPQDDDIMIVNQPELKFYMNEDNIISEDTCVVINKGCFILNNSPERAQIEAILSFEISDDKIKDVPVKLNILNGAIDTENPIEMDCFVYPNDVETKKIQLFVRDHERPNIIAAFQDEDEFVKVF